MHAVYLKRTPEDNEPMLSKDVFFTAMTKRLLYTKAMKQKKQRSVCVEYSWAISVEVT